MFIRVRSPDFQTVHVLTNSFCIRTSSVELRVMMIQYIYMYFYVLVLLHRVQVCISITNRPPSTLATDGHRDLNQFAAERLLLAVKGVVVVQPPLKTQKSNSDRHLQTSVHIDSPATAAVFCYFPKTYTCHKPHCL